jgi:hypothetical protein
LLTDARLAVPEITDQVPIPCKTLFAFNVAVLLQTVCWLPAFEMVGGRSLVIETVDEEGAQTPLVIVHSKILMPGFKAETVDNVLPGFETVEVPVNTDHEPVPIKGAFEVIVAVEEQTVWLLPAAEIVGGRSRAITTVEVEGGQTPLVMRHSKTF